MSVCSHGYLGNYLTHDDKTLHSYSTLEMEDSKKKMKKSEKKIEVEIVFQNLFF